MYAAENLKTTNLYHYSSSSGLNHLVAAYFRKQIKLQASIRKNGGTYEYDDSSPMVDKLVDTTWHKRVQKNETYTFSKGIL